MEIAKNKIDDVFDALDINYRRNARKYVANCPIHGGDSQDSFILWPDGREGKAYWVCLSNHCERTFNCTVLGLVRGVLSHQINEWQGDGDDELKVSQDVAIEFLCKTLNVSWDSIKPDLDLAKRNQFVAAVEALTSTGKKSSTGICTRSKLRNMLETPSQYYIDRGYSPEILNRYDVGLCIHPQSDLYGRIVVPLYSNDGKFVVGCIGRSPFPECPNCGKHHHPKADCDEYRPEIETCKWRCSKRFNDKNHLYNFWNANNHVIDCNRTIVVVEGCGDVWRLEEAGIHNAVALNGSDLTEPQQIAIECSGATHILCLTDSDKAGERAYVNMVKRCWFAKTTRLHAVGVKDVGELKIDDPLFDRIKDICQNRHL